jgi:hypothetical protein
MTTAAQMSAYDLKRTCDELEIETRIRSYEPLPSTIGIEGKDPSNFLRIARMLSTIRVIASLRRGIAK